MSGMGVWQLQGAGDERPLLSSLDRGAELRGTRLLLQGLLRSRFFPLLAAYPGCAGLCCIGASTSGSLDVHRVALLEVVRVLEPREIRGQPMKRMISIAMASAILSSASEPGILVKAFQIAKTLPSILEKAERSISR
jgi:hypothetical protein